MTCTCREGVLSRCARACRTGLAFLGSIVLGMGLFAAWQACGVQAPAKAEAASIAAEGGAEGAVLTAGARERLMRHAFAAICVVESRSGRDPRSTRELPTGELGPAQITRTRVDDVNRILKEPRFTYPDRLSRERSWQMFQASCLHYWPGGGPEQWARHWNGGPVTGPSSGATLAYWGKVQAAMRKGAADATQ